MTKMPKVCDAKQGHYAVVRVEAKVSRSDELLPLGADIAADHGITRPKTQILELEGRGDVYLIVVTKDDR